MTIPYVRLVDRRPSSSSAPDAPLPPNERDGDFTLPIIVAHPRTPAEEVARLPVSTWVVDTALTGYGVTGNKFLLRVCKLMAEDPGRHAPPAENRNWLPYVGPTEIGSDSLGKVDAGLFSANLWLAPGPWNSISSPYFLGTFEIAVVPGRERTLLGRDVLTEAGLRVIIDCPPLDELLERMPTISLEGPA